MRIDHLKIRTMRYIVMVADGKTIGQVARKFNASKPCVCRCIQRTEFLLDTQIFKREKLRIGAVTAEGQTLVDRFRGVIEALDDEVQEAA